MMKNIIILFAVFGFIFACFPVNARMTVEEAYRAIPHKQTNFDPDTVNMRPEDAVYLERFFHLVNRAVLQRVQTLKWFATAGKEGKDFTHYRKEIEDIISELEELNVPKRLKSTHQTVIQAISEQYSYYRNWNRNLAEGKTFRFSRLDPLVNSSHHKLIKTYNSLMRFYPKETRQNKAAFFDHLCALDFI